jgi:ferredoxin-NADP reductase
MGEPLELTLVVEDVARAADDVLALILADPDGAELPKWQAGAHVDLLLGERLERQYSLCGDAGDAARWRIAVLREPASRGGSEWVHTQLRHGDRITVRGPRNNFPLVDADDYVFVAGGIGITPVLPMIESAAAQGRPWELVYGGRRASAMAFTDELARHGDHVTFWPQDRLGLIDLDTLLGVPRSGTAVYCCGPEALIDAVETRCATWPAGTLHVERFRPRPGSLDGEDIAFELVLDHTGISLTVGAGESIVEALESAGVTVDTSCREGTCGTCETLVLEGDPDHRDSFLQPEERASGATMMICSSRSRSPRLVLDL